MRFEISRVLDAVQARLTLDPALARAVVDLAEVVRLVDLDGDHGRPASLLRLGRVLDALALWLAEDGAAAHVVVDRSVLSDLDLSANERMVVRRWADDGLVEVLAAVDDRALSVAELLSVPVVTRQRFAPYADRYPWLPHGLLAPGAQGLSPVSGGGLPGPPAAPVLTRVWHCPQSPCPGFAEPTGAQPPPLLQAAAPLCPRHGTRLADAGPRPPAQVLAVRIDGAVRSRFVVREQSPALVGRAPGGADADAAEAPGTPMASGTPSMSMASGTPGTPTLVALGPWLGEEAGRWVSRAHLRLDLRGDALTLTDTSTNGTRVRTPGGTVTLAAGQTYVLGPDDVVQLHQGVELARPARLGSRSAPESSVMADAPTVTIRPGTRD